MVSSLSTETGFEQTNTPNKLYYLPCSASSILGAITIVQSSTSQSIVKLSTPAKVQT